MPQVEILHHPNTNAFLSHGGSNSLIESIEAEVPIIISPISVYDQFMHCYLVEERMIGKCVPHNEAENIILSLQEIERGDYSA